MAKGKGKKPITKSTKKPKKDRPKVNIADSYSYDSNIQTPDVDYLLHKSEMDEPAGEHVGEITDIYIPMKVFTLETFQEISAKCKDCDYREVQKEPLFQKSLRDEDLLSDVFNVDHKMIVLAEAGNGKTTFARRIIKTQQEKFPNNLTFFLNLKEIGRKKECTLADMLLPEEYQKSKGSQSKSASALKIISDAPDECLFIIDSIEEFEDREKIIKALVTGQLETSDDFDAVQEEGIAYDTVLPTWQWINELLIGRHFNRENKKTRVIMLARPETVAYYDMENPFHHCRPGVGWSKLHQLFFSDSGFSIYSIFGLAVNDLRDHFPKSALEYRKADIHEAFLEFLEQDSGFAYFCRKPFQMFLFYDTFNDVAGNL